MDLRGGVCTILLMATFSTQPSVAAGAPAAKPKPTLQTLQLANVPMKQAAAEDTSASATQTTGSQNIGFQLDELDAPKACPGGGNATFTWKLSDGCFDGLGIYVRFFDETNDLVYPNSSQAYVINSGRSSTIKLSVKRGAKICYGAEPNPRDGSYWGVGLDDDQGCDSCCNIVPATGNPSRSVNLVCD